MTQAGAINAIVIVLTIAAVAILVAVLLMSVKGQAPVEEVGSIEETPWRTIRPDRP